jgi:RNA recognition motif-containing protein
MICPRCNGIMSKNEHQYHVCGCGMRKYANGNYQLLLRSNTTSYVAVSSVVWCKNDDYRATYNNYDVYPESRIMLGKLPYTITKEDLDKYLILV